MHVFVGLPALLRQRCARGDGTLRQGLHQSASDVWAFRGNTWHATLLHNHRGCGQAPQCVGLQRLCLRRVATGETIGLLRAPQHSTACASRGAGGTGNSSDDGMVSAHITRAELREATAESCSDRKDLEVSYYHKCGTLWKNG